MLSRFTILMTASLIALSSFTPGSAADEINFDSQFATYGEMRTHLGDLFASEKSEEAVALLEWGRERFPEHLHANSFNLALVLGRLGELDRGVAALDYALDRGVFFGKWALGSPAFAAYQDREDFAEVKKRSDAMLEEAESKAEVKIEVETPEGYTPDRAWPLFIALHGGGENLETFKPRWTSRVLEKEFVVAYVQSDQVASMTGFHWQDEAKTTRSLAAAFERISADFKVDSTDVIVGGFSSGGFASLVVTFHDSIPATGFVALCPPVPETLSGEMIEQASARGVRGTVLSTEFDARLEEQRALVGRLGEAGLDVNLVVTPDTGHWYPENLSLLIDEAVAVIRQP